MVFNSSLPRHDRLGGGQHLFGCRDHVVGLAAVLLGRCDQLFVGAADTPAAVTRDLLLHPGSSGKTGAQTTLRGLRDGWGSNSQDLWIKIFFVGGCSRWV